MSRRSEQSRDLECPRCEQAEIQVKFFIVPPERETRDCPGSEGGLDDLRVEPACEVCGLEGYVDELHDDLSRVIIQSIDDQLKAESDLYEDDNYPD